MGAGRPSSTNSIELIQADSPKENTDYLNADYPKQRGSLEERATPQEIPGFVVHKIYKVRRSKLRKDALNASLAGENTDIHERVLYTWQHSRVTKFDPEPHAFKYNPGSRCDSRHFRPRKATRGVLGILGSVVREHNTA